MSDTSYKLCHRCAAAITNDDYSAFDFDNAEKAKEKAIDFVEKAGLIVIDVDETDLRGSCDACGEDIDGPGHTAEPQ